MFNDLVLMAAMFMQSSTVHTVDKQWSVTKNMMTRFVPVMRIMIFSRKHH